MNFGVNNSESTFFHKDNHTNSNRLWLNMDKFLMAVHNNKIFVSDHIVMSVIRDESMESATR